MHKQLNCFQGYLLRIKIALPLLGGDQRNECDVCAHPLTFLQSEIIRKGNVNC